METQLETTRSSALGRRRLLGAGVASAAGLGGAALGASPAAARGEEADQNTVYDVTKWRVSGRPGLTAKQDIGAIINDIITDIKRRQPDRNAKPGAAIVIPPGDYDLRTPVVVDISFLTIAGYGHGFNSLSIRYNADTAGWVELNPGGSHIRVLTPSSTAAFAVRRDAAPRLSGIVFRDFCLDGVSFEPDQNSYRNGRTGIEVSTDNDSLHITGMGFVYLERALVVRGADVFTPQGRVDVQGARVEVVDTIGAGDTFSAAVIDGLWSSGLLGAHNRVRLRDLALPQWRRVAEYAALAAGVVVSRPGADPPYLHELSPKLALLHP